MKVAIDTNRYRDLSEGIPEAIEVCENAAELFIPLFVLAELRAGFAAGSRQAQNESALQAFLADAGVEVLLPDEATSHHYGDLYAELKRKGKPIPTNDLWIAALCIQHRVALYARDRHFDQVSQLARL